MVAKEFYAELLEVLRAHEKAAVISVYEGNKDADFEDDNARGVPLSGENVTKEIIGSGNTEAWKRVEALWAREDAESSGPVTAIQTRDSLTVIERYTAKPRLIILGGGHIAVALTQMAALLDFDMIVYDDRPAFANAQRFPQAQVICDSFEKLFERVRIRSTDFVVVVTRGHKHDAACLHGILANAEPMYTGMIGSRRRVAIVMDQLREAGHDHDRIDRIHSPIGIRIGAVTPAEIAISILAEIISVRRTDQAAQDLSSCDLEIVEELAKQGDEMSALITIFDTTGSVPIECGAKLAMSYEGRILGTIGGGCSEADAMQAAREAIRKGIWLTHTVDMTDSAEEDGMVCGGEMHVVIELLK